MIGVEPITSGLSDQKVCKLQLLECGVAVFLNLKNLGIRGGAQVREANPLQQEKTIGFEPTIRSLERYQFVSFFS